MLRPYRDRMIDARPASAGFADSFAASWQPVRADGAGYHADDERHSPAEFRPRGIHHGWRVYGAGGVTGGVVKPRCYPRIVSFSDGLSGADLPLHCVSPIGKTQPFDLYDAAG